jgi:lipid-binding SYLF domain-containing protein
MVAFWMEFHMRSLAFTTVLTALFIGSVGCSTVPVNETEREKLRTEVDSTLAKMTAEDASLRRLLDRSAGYAVFPAVGKGGFIAGAAYGKGHVFANDRWIGYSDITQGTVGLQAGGQTYDELIVFKDKAALNRFKTGQFALAAGYSAVALKANVADQANFSDGVVVFVRPEGGAMVDASIGGQKFSFVPASVFED